MTRYRFRVMVQIWGNYDAEIGDKDPEEFAEELIEEGLTINNINIMNDEIEIDEWDEVSDV